MSNSCSEVNDKLFRIISGNLNAFQNPSPHVLIVVSSDTAEDKITQVVNAVHQTSEKATRYPIYLHPYQDLIIYNGFPYFIGKNVPFSCEQDVFLHSQDTINGIRWREKAVFYMQQSSIEEEVKGAFYVVDMRTIEKSLNPADLTLIADELRDLRRFNIGIIFITFGTYNCLGRHSFREHCSLHIEVI